MAQRFIVVFKKTASQETIDEQASAINQMFNSPILKGFSAQIPDTYLLALQNSLQGGDSQIDYIGKADAV
ncbi:hypothetical protein BGY98DRAFT_980161 [Russula aff. rugulosa BPL654]|nr:hypothetical protein BGY98DRAFT_980161 [Russula aff. rugulosa BPL654]